MTTLYSYGKDDQLLREETLGISVTTYGYDKNGNTVSRTTTEAGTRTYGYDYENRLTAVTTPNTSETYQYAPDGRRLKRVAGGSPTYYGYDSAGASGYEDTIEEYAATGSKTASYVHGPGVDEPIGQKSASWSYQHKDALGSVTRLTDSSGGTSGTYRYDAFGAYRSQSGASSLYGYASRENNAPVGLYYYRARHYDPDHGRFLSEDPAGLSGGTNQYSYVGGNPITRTDPSGRMLVEGNEGIGSRYHPPPDTPPPPPSPPPSQANSLMCLLGWAMLAISVGFALLGIFFIVGDTIASFAYNAVTVWQWGVVNAGITQSPWALLSLIVSIAWWVLWNLLLPSLPWWQALGVGASAAGQAAAWPVLLAKLVGLGITITIALAGLKARGCW